MESKGARKNQKEPKRARRSQEEPQGATRSKEKPAGARINQGGAGKARRSLVISRFHELR